MIICNFNKARTGEVFMMENKVTLRNNGTKKFMKEDNIIFKEGDCEVYQPLDFENISELINKLQGGKTLEYTKSKLWQQLNPYASDITGTNKSGETNNTSQNAEANLDFTNGEYHEANLNQLETKLQEITLQCDNIKSILDGISTKLDKAFQSYSNEFELLHQSLQEHDTKNRATYVKTQKSFEEYICKLNQVIQLIKENNCENKSLWEKLSSIIR